MLNFRLINRLILVSVFFFISGCKCGDVFCPALKEQYSLWISYAEGDTVKFVNDSGYEVAFVVSSSEISQSYSYACSRDGYGGCLCHECHTKNSRFTASTTDTSWRIPDSLGNTDLLYKYFTTNVDKPNESHDTAILQYYLFDHYNLITVGPSLALHGNDSLFPTIVLNSKTYSNVIVHQKDTSIVNPNPVYDTDFIFKSYFNKKYGIIAFYDLRTQSMFYRK